MQVARVWWDNETVHFRFDTSTIGRICSFSQSPCLQEVDAILILHRQDPQPLHLASEGGRYPVQFLRGRQQTIGLWQLAMRLARTLHSDVESQCTSRSSLPTTSKRKEVSTQSKPISFSSFVNFATSDQTYTGNVVIRFARSFESALS